MGSSFPSSEAKSRLPSPAPSPVPSPPPWAAAWSPPTRCPRLLLDSFSTVVDFLANSATVDFLAKLMVLLQVEQTSWKRWPEVNKSREKQKDCKIGSLAASLASINICRELVVRH